MWRLAIPDDPGAVKETKNFALIGNVSPAMLDEVATLAESQAATIGKIFKAPEDKPLVKGKMTLFVCRQRFRLHRIRQDGRNPRASSQRPGALSATTSSMPTAASFHPPPAATNYSLTALVDQQVAGHVHRQHGPFARLVCRRRRRRDGFRTMDKTDGRLRGWEAAIPGIISSTPNANAFLNHGLATEVNDCLSMGFAKSLMGNAGRFQQLLNAIKQGDDFETVFRRIYRLPPAELAAAWAARAG